MPFLALGKNWVVVQPLVNHPTFGAMNLELTDEETAALLKELDGLIDGDPFNLFHHAPAPLSHHSRPGRRDERQSLYWRSKRNLPRDFRRDRPAGAQVPFRCSKHRDSWATPGLAGPVRLVYTADQPITVRQGTGIEPLVPRENAMACFEDSDQPAACHSNANDRTVANTRAGFGADVQMSLMFLPTFRWKRVKAGCQRFYRRR